MQTRQIPTIDKDKQGNNGPQPYPANMNQVQRTQPIPGTPVSRGPALSPGVRDESHIPGWALAIAILFGAVLALATIPVWVPILGASVVGPEPKVYWYLSRASALVAFFLIWFSMASGIIISNKLARIWPGGFTAFDLHQFTSLLGLGFGAFHAIILIGNQYLPYSLAQIIIPFTGTDYRPLWVSLGQIGIYLLALVTFTFYFRKQMGNRTWHMIHYLSYAVYVMILLHSLFSGTDTGNVWISEFYWISGVSLLILTIYRVAVSKMEPAK